MSRECYVSECKKRVYYGCSCSKDLLLCKNHCGSHFISFGYHIPIKLFVKIPDEHKNSLYQYMKAYMSILNQNIINLRSFTQKLINGIQKESHKLLYNLITERTKFKNTLKELITNSLIDIENHDYHFKNNRNKIQKIRFEFNTCFEMIKKSFNQPIFESIFSNDEYAIIFKKEVSSSFDLVDLENYKITTLKNCGYKSLVKESICCKIDYNQYFVYGGRSGNDLINSAEILDIDNYSLTHIPSWKNLGNASACFYNNNIYCFGGNPERNSSYVFNLEKKVWATMGDLPEKLFHTSTYYYKGEILICGYQSSTILKFNPTTQNFVFSDYSLIANKQKYLIHNWVVCFENFLYEIDEEGNMISRQYIGDKGRALNSSCIFQRDYYLYFINIDSVLFRINTLNKSIQRINLDIKV